MWEGLFWHAVETLIYGMCLAIGERIIDMIWKVDNGKDAENEGSEFREGDS